MRDVLGPGTTLGYCTNVHAGETLDEIKANLETHALEVKRIVSPNESMGIGLWLPASVARELVLEHEALRFRDWLAERGFEIFTINGFPYGDFHQASVKYDVYHPDWRDERREQYTLDLMRILAQVLPEGAEGSISTLPIGWGDFDIERRTAGQIDPEVSLVHAAQFAEHIEDQYGRLIHIDLEPEPGCYLQYSYDVVDYFENVLSRVLCREETIRRYIRVCHDVCHASVMFEGQAEVIDRYRIAGISIGKVQISNAVKADLRNRSDVERTDAIAQLVAMDEERYLHQTVHRHDDALVFFDDLPLAKEEFEQSDRAGNEWRTHFHVPVYIEQFGLLQTTRDDILKCLRALRPEDEVHHFEVETYAWNVLPAELQASSLAEGIARELQWVKDHAAGIIAP